MGDKDITLIRPEDGTVCTEPESEEKQKASCKTERGKNNSCIQIISSRFQDRLSCSNHSICPPLLHSNTHAVPCRFWVWSDRPNLAYDGNPRNRSRPSVRRNIVKIRRNIVEKHRNIVGMRRNVVGMRRNS